MAILTNTTRNHDLCLNYETSPYMSKFTDTKDVNNSFKNNEIKKSKIYKND